MMVVMRTVVVVDSSPLTLLGWQQQHYGHVLDAGSCGGGGPRRIETHSLATHQVHRGELDIIEMPPNVAVGISCCGSASQSGRDHDRRNDKVGDVYASWVV